MVNSALRHDASLAEVLSSRARSASDLRLALDAMGGVTAASAAMVWRPFGWFFVVSAATCFAAFGLWGIADRELNNPLRRPPRVVIALLKAVRVVAVVAGGVAAVALICAIVAIPLGKSWMS
jgi:hypothetical protein